MKAKHKTVTIVLKILVPRVNLEIILIPNTMENFSFATNETMYEFGRKLLLVIKKKDMNL